MERDNSPTFSTHDSSSLTAIYFCSTCDKPYANEISRDRHHRYCGTRTLRRLRSCRACNTAKTKCSFETPCLRCKKKGIECIYDDSAAGGRQVLSRSSVAAQRAKEMPRSRQHTALPDDALRPQSEINANGHSTVANDTIFNQGEFSFADDPATNSSEVEFVSGNGNLSNNLSMQRSSLNESLSLAELFAFEDYASGQYEFPAADVSLDPYDKMNHHSESWCAWTLRGLSLSVVTENPMVKPNSNLLEILQVERPHAQHSADLIILSLRSFPTMMMRRETFPWFIHVNSHLLSMPTRAALPEALSTCMSIAQMFASRTSETKHILWRTIRAEYRRFVEEMYQMSAFELLAAFQACMIYLIMCIVDHSPDVEENGLELLLALQSLFVSFKVGCGRNTSQSEFSSPSSNWENWIFAESQRRLSSLWFLIGCVMSVKTGNPYDTSQSYRSLPLPSPKSLWEAPTLSAWESEYEASRVFQVRGLITLGDLIDVQRSQYTPSNARKLDEWNAGTDNIGSLLNLVGTMV